MTTAPAKHARQMPKGGRKGGSIFPRVQLSEAVAYAKKLVSKTHTGPQARDVLLSGVFGAKGGRGVIRMSALKQYGLLAGDAKANFSAAELARKIAAAPMDELIPLYRQAVLRPTVFKKLCDTFHGDTVSKAKLKQRSADLKVHPDETATCVDLYVSGMLTAGLVTVEGEQVVHLPSSDVTAPASSIVGDARADAANGLAGDAEPTDAAESVPDLDEPVQQDLANDTERPTQPAIPNGTHPLGPKAVFNVNVSLDSSLDIEKLQKQLELLKRFGAI